MRKTRQGQGGKYARRDRVRVLGAVVTVRVDKGDQGSRCPVCTRTGLSAVSSGALRKHRDLFGADCFNRAHEQGRSVDPDAALAAQERSFAEAAKGVTPPLKKKHEPKVAPVRLCTGRCHVCDRPITGERRFCGPCAANQEPQVTSKPTLTDTVEYV